MMTLPRLFIKASFVSCCLIMPFLNNGYCDSPMEHFEKGSNHFRQGDYAAAIQSLSDAIDGNPELNEAYLLRGIAYSKVQKHKDAINDFTSALTPEQNDTAYYFRGIAYAQIGQGRRALQDFDKAIALNPRNGDAYARRAMEYFVFKDYDRSWSDVTKAEELECVFFTKKDIDAIKLDIAIAKNRRWNFPSDGPLYKGLVGLVAAIPIVTIFSIVEFFRDRKKRKKQ